MDWNKQKNKYALLLKTGDAELRAAKYFSDLKDIFPIIELTRGRKSKNDKEGDVQKRLKQVGEIFRNKDIILDITSDSALSNPTINNLYNPKDGYIAWIDFLSNISSLNIFNKIYPTIMVNWEDDTNIEENIRKEVESLCKQFDGIVYRNNIEDTGYLDDIELIKKNLQTKSTDFIFIIDCTYLLPASINNCVETATKRIREISKILPQTVFILTATSYPNNVGDSDYDTIKLTEVLFYNKVKEEFPSQTILYGDYGSINPIRNDEVSMARGWRPKIDVPLSAELYYYRRRKGKEKYYSPVYNLVAKEVIKDTRFPYELNHIWGVQQILNCAEGGAPGATASLWISVRVHIHAEHQLKRLGLLS